LRHARCSRDHGGLELLLDVAAEGDAPDALHAPRAAIELRACIGADAARRCAPTTSTGAEQLSSERRREAPGSLGW
jgi:hypothetical protein